MRAHTAERLLLSMGALPAFVEDVIGDIEEERAQREAAGLGEQSRWFTRQIVAAMPYAMRQGLRERRTRSMLRLLETSLAAWLIVSVGLTIPLLCAVGLYTVVTGSPVPEFTSGQLPVWSALPLGVASAAAVGYTAAWLDRSRPLLAAMASGALWAGVQSGVLLGNLSNVAGWQWGMPIVIAIAVTLGGLYRVSRHTPRLQSLPAR